MVLGPVCANSHACGMCASRKRVSLRVKRGAGAGNVGDEGGWSGQPAGSSLWRWGGPPPPSVFPLLPPSLSLCLGFLLSLPASPQPPALTHSYFKGESRIPPPSRCRPPAPLSSPAPRGQGRRSVLGPVLSVTRRSLYLHTPLVPLETDPLPLPSLPHATVAAKSLRTSVGGR